MKVFVDIPGKTEPGKKALILSAIFLILLFRIIVQVALYHAGFLSLTADEFGRTVLAANWSRNPVIYWSGLWLPIYTYLLGTLLKVHWDLYNTSRLLVYLSGGASLVLMFMLASQLFNSWKVGLVSCFLLAVNPVHIWLSSTPLTEMLHAMLVIASLWAFTLYLKNFRRLYLYASACLIALASGIRFEAWLISSIYSLALVTLAALAFTRKQKGYPIIIRDVVLALIVIWVFPIAWIIGNFTSTGNPLYFLDAIKDYKILNYGNNVSYAREVETWFRIDPFLVVLAVPILALIFLKNRKAPEALVYLVVVTVPFAIYLFLHGGQPEPPGNYLRYSALFVFLFYPGLGYLLNSGVTLLKSRTASTILLCFLLAIITVFQLRSAFRFTNDPAADGLAVGFALRDLRSQNPAIAERPVIVELSYWQYTAIHVGANDVDHIIYDRKLDYSRSTPSLIQSDFDQFLFCLDYYRPSYLLLKSPELKQIVENKLRLSSVKEINGYAFYPVDETLMHYSGTENGTCSLSIGDGE